MKLKRTIGILMDSDVFAKVPLKRTGYEKLDFYHKAAKSRNLSVFLMTLNQIDFGKRKARGWVKKGGAYRRAEKSIPAVVHNRAMPFSTGARKKLRKLCGISRVFNRQTRYDKLKICQWLRADPFLTPHLPKTRRFSRRGLSRMAGQFNALFIKPRSGSVGKGIYKLSRSGESARWVLRSAGARKTLNEAAAYSALKKKIGSKPYLIQEGIKLPRYKGRPFDIRVSVQKNGSGLWHVTGMVGKVAGKGRFLTNVARGGKVKSCETLFAHSGLPVDHTQARVAQTSLRIARRLDGQTKGLADLGLDVGVDRQGEVKLIEVNGRDQRYAFREGKMKKTWYHTYKNPIEYGYFLLKRDGFS